MDIAGHGYRHSSVALKRLFNTWIFDNYSNWCIGNLALHTFRRISF